jgi:hypothetical protein
MDEWRYDTSKIYIIKSPSTDLVYVGSTIHELNERFSRHKCKSNVCTSKEILKFNDAYIELIENYPCKSYRELLEREKYFISITPNCVNKMMIRPEFKLDKDIFKAALEKRLNEYNYSIETAPAHIRHMHTQLVISDLKREWKKSNPFFKTHTP